MASLNLTTETLLAIIAVVILLQLMVFNLPAIWRRRRDYRELGSGDGATPEPAAPAAAPEAPVAAWEGFREFVVKRREFEDANRSICSFYLAPVDGEELPAYRPGQFLTFKLNIGGEQGQSVIRCYSLSDAHHPNHYRVSIKRVPAPADRPELPAGLSSNFFHDQVVEGSRLQVRAPSGHFHLMDEGEQPIVLIGGGIGITPMLSILNTVLTSASQREVWLFYGVRNGNEHIMKQPLQQLAQQHSNFHLHVAYSAPNEQDVTAVDYQHQGRVDVALLRNTLKMARYQYYVCGPGPMMESLIPSLQEWGVNAQDIHYESFGPASVNKSAGASAPGKEVAATVTFSRAGRSIAWDSRYGSLLEFAEANDIAVEAGCRAGSCGCCQTLLSSGQVDYNQEPDADIEPGHCLLCISVPAGDLTLDA